MPHWLKLVTDLGPLAVFFLGYRLFGLLEATASLIGATLLALAICYLYEKRLAIMPLVTAIAVTVFGGLTLYLQDELFIKMKPTLVNLLFATILLVGVARKKPLLRYLLEGAIPMDDKAWLTLSLRWGLFFIFLAGVNEAIWRNFSTDFWVNFKVFGMFTLTLLFTAAQLPFMMKHKIDEAESDQDSGSL